MKAKIIDYNHNIFESDYAKLNVDNSIVVCKSDDLFLVKKGDLTIPCNYSNFIMEAYINNSDNKIIYFVGFDDEEIKKIDEIGEKVHNKVSLLNRYNIINKMIMYPNFDYDDSIILCDLETDENLLSLIYKVIRDNKEEDIHLRINNMYEASLEYTDGDIINEDNINVIKDRLEEKILIPIELKHVKNKEKVKKLS